MIVGEDKYGMTRVDSMVREVDRIAIEIYLLKREVREGYSDLIVSGLCENSSFGKGFFVEARENLT